MSAASGRRIAAASLVRAVCGRVPGSLGDDDLQALIDAAERRRVLPTLAWRCRQAGLVPALPWGALEVLRRRVEEHGEVPDPRLLLALTAHVSAQRSANLRDTAELLVGALRDAGVPVLRLKGAHLADTGWFPLGARSAQDVDLLVRPADGARAVGVLRGLGWVDYESPEPWRQRAGHHLPAMVRDGHAGSVELHVEVLPPRWRPVLRAEEVWGGAVDGPGGQMLRDDHAVTLAILHAMGSDGAWRGRSLPVRLLADLAARTECSALGPVDGEAIAERFSRRGEASLLAGLGALAARLEVPLPFLPEPHDHRAGRAGARWARHTLWLEGRPALGRRVRSTAIALSQLNVEQLAQHYGPQVRRRPRRAQARYVLDRVRRERSHAGGVQGDDRA